MPFTPLHMGPGMLIKALLQSGFSLMVFGWTQIIMDLQPLSGLIAGHSHLHGFSHTFIGCSILAVFSALSGKYLSELGLRILGISKSSQAVRISWLVAFSSAFIGSFSHVCLDAIMHSDVQPFYPFSFDNPLQGVLTISNLHKLCLYTGLIGTVIFYVLHWHKRKANKKRSSSSTV